MTPTRPIVVRMLGQHADESMAALPVAEATGAPAAPTSRGSFDHHADEAQGSLIGRRP